MARAPRRRSGVRGLLDNAADAVDRAIIRQSSAAAARRRDLARDASRRAVRAGGQAETDAWLVGRVAPRSRALLAGQARDGAGRARREASESRRQARGSRRAADTTRRAADRIRGRRRGG